MNAPLPTVVTRDNAARAAGTIARLGGPEAAQLAHRLATETQGEVLFDAASRGRYATDASIYQVMPVGVFVPRCQDDVAAAIAIARELGTPLLSRGAGTSQCGQTTGAALVVDSSKHLRKLLAFDKDAMTAEVEPGLVLDALNAELKPHGLWFQSTFRPARKQRSAAWPATTRAARAASLTATWCTTCSASMPG